MAGISSEALNSDPVNKKKFNGGTEIESNDFLDGSGLEIYSTRFRSLDPQLGKFLQIDALEGLALSASPFSYAGNNPVSFNDPLGLSWKDSIRTASGDYAYANNPDLANITISGGIRKRSVNFIYWPQIHKGQTEWNNEMYARQRDGKMLITGSEPDWVLKDLAFHKRNYQSYQDYRIMSLTAVFLIGSPVMIASLSGTGAASIMLNAGFNNPLALSGRFGQIAKVKALMGVGNAVADSYYQINSLAMRSQLSLGNYNYGSTLGNLIFSNPFYSSFSGALNSSVNGESFLSNWGKGLLGDAIGNTRIPGGRFGLRLGMEGFTLPLLGNLTADVLTGGFIEPEVEK